MVTVLRNRAFLSILFLIFYALTLKSQTNQRENIKADIAAKLEVNGNLKGLKEGEKVYLRKLFYTAKRPNWILIDSSEVQKGKFYFEHRLEDGPRLFMFSFSNHLELIVVALSNENVTINSDKDIDEYIGAKTSGPINEYILIDGSKTANDFLYLAYGIYRTWFYTTGAINSQIKHFRDSTMSEENLAHIVGLLDSKNSLFQAVKNTIMYLGPKRELSPELFSDCEPEMMRDSLWVPLYNSFPEDIKKSYYGKIMKDQLYLCMGQSAPDFKFNSTDGKPFSLEEVAKKNKVTVLHFWANKSLDRKRINEELAKAYKKYHDKGLEVVNVSLDANADKWKRIIQEDKIPGYQFCDFKEEESSIAQLYDMDPKNTINILIDQNGKMIAYDVDGPAFFGHLFKLFKE